MRGMPFIAGLLVVAVVGLGCSGTLSKHKGAVARGPVFEDLPVSTADKTEEVYQIGVTDPAPFFVTGEVNAPGKRPFTGPVTVLKAIESAGGFTGRANKRKVRLVRANGQAFMVNCAKARTDPRQDLEVYPGDRVLVAVGPLW